MKICENSKGKTNERQTENPTSIGNPSASSANTSGPKDVINVKKQTTPPHQLNGRGYSG